NWRGLLMDCDRAYIERIKNDEIYWKHELTAVECFVTKDNINQVITENGFKGEIGLLHIDIDGNDYWIWESISQVSPVIVIVEYNSVFGPGRAVTIPYDPHFTRTKAHFSNLYWGCSLKALCLLAEKKDYSFIGSNSNGNNAYFVRRGNLGKIPALSCAQGYVESKFRESRDALGNLTYLTGRKRLEEIKAMEVFDTENQTLVKLSELISQSNIP
ncbi:MAG: hypothetical protein QME74_11210, partial [Candidatus Edwardsbacteria bacterium]|nr:hypothetical protein [Candidatus Edwardsbacteria bacterium]